MKTALITGATGVVGRNLAKHLLSLPDWKVISVSRRKPDLEGDFQHIALDLLDPIASTEKLGTPADVTHLFACAYVERPSWSELVAPNLALLVNAVESVERGAKNLQHVHIVQGTKW